ncbi:MAG: DUF4435 domain-containing protein [Candidatus Methanoplasma sp.]|jgi:hypothetical protein|nr:DUF4435 domain-containing protein [Candidatus Methanoplasma sp.]
MIDKLTAEDIANSISMLRSSHSGPVMIVEGVTDCRLYGKFIDRNEVVIVPAHSRDNVRKALAEAWGHRGDRRVIGIVDADLDILFGKANRPPLFSTDKRDLEAMMLSTRAFEDVLSEYADGDRLASFEKRHGDVRDAVSGACVMLGLMMFVSIRDNMGLSFKDIDHSAFIDERSLRADVRKMTDEVFAGSMNANRGKRDVIDAVTAEAEAIDDPWTAVRGHDAVAVLKIGLLSAFGAYNSKGLEEGRLAGSLRLAFGMGYFTETRLYADILEWGNKNNMVFWISR